MRDADVEITRVTELTPELVDALRRLVPQLAPSSPLPREADLAEMIHSPGCTLFVARDRGARRAIVGALTLVVYRIPSGVRVWIEDVVVDQPMRGAGIGEALVRTALKRAAELGAARVDLTSRPEREAANRLYQRMGFVRRETNAYRYFIPSAGS